MEANRTRTAQGRSSAHICVSLSQTGESSQAWTPQEEPLRPDALTYLTTRRRRLEVSPPLPHLHSANTDLSKQTNQIHQQKGQSGLSPQIRINFAGLIKYRSSGSTPTGIRLEEQTLGGTTPCRAPPNRGRRTIPRMSRRGDVQLDDLSRTRHAVSVLG